MKKDLKLVRETLKTTLEQIKQDKISLPKANSINYTCSNITRTIIAEILLNKSNEKINN